MSRIPIIASVGPTQSGAAPGSIRAELRALKWEHWALDAITDREASIRRPAPIPSLTAVRMTPSWRTRTAVLRDACWPLRSRSTRLPSPRRWGVQGAPENIAAAVAYLVSADADYVAGRTLSVNGGRYLN